MSHAAQTITPGYSASPAFDAASYYDALASDTFDTDITFHGLELSVEISRKSGEVIDIYSADGTDVFCDFTEHAIDQIGKLAKGYRA